MFLIVGASEIVPKAKLSSARELRLRIVLERPPSGVDFGLQKGRGSAYETIQKQRSQTKDLYFEFTVEVKGGRKAAMPTLLGPLAQGPPGERFVYIDIGTYAGQADSLWSRRLKIPLRGITWDMIDRLADDSRAVLEARVPGTGRDGGPTCGTVKAFDGWKLERGTRG
jgi:Family of unknown function (DUF5990)